MVILDRSRQLKKEISFFGVFAISLGATLSSGFFLLPGLAAQEAGPAVVITYLIALLPLIPGILSKIELATAMPRAGGVYYFLDRAFGPLMGTIGGIGTWCTLILKVAFALVGMGAYVHLFWHDAPREWIAVGFAIIFGAINLLGAGRTGRFQIVLVTGLGCLLIWFIGRGTFSIEISHFDGFFDQGSRAILGTSGLVCVSYIGLTKVASVSEEVRDPERNLPRAMIVSLVAATIIYVLGTSVMVGVLRPGDWSESSPHNLLGNLTPVAAAADVMSGRVGAIVMSVAAVLAFLSVANAGILSASRYPLAMSRDRLMPSAFQNLTARGTPTISIILTVALIGVTILAFHPLRIAKLAGAFQMLLFASNCAAVIIMRESRIDSYDPGYRVPLYPWLQIVGIIAPFVLIAEMGWVPAFGAACLFIAGGVWFFVYARRRVQRRGAIYHLFGRLGPQRYAELDRELRSILKEKGLRAGDPFDELIVRAEVLDLAEARDFESIADRVGHVLSQRIEQDARHLSQRFQEGTRTGATPVTGGFALPHLRLPNLDRAHLALVRCASGIDLPPMPGMTPKRTFAFFFLISPEEDAALHLRMLAQIASHVERDGFLDDWRDAASPRELRRLLLRDDRYLSIELGATGSTSALIGKSIREVRFPAGCLIAVIHRAGESLVPDGSTVLEPDDRLVVIGNEKAMVELRRHLARDAPGAKAN